MSKEEVVRVAIPKNLFEIATKLGMIKVGDIEVHLHPESSIIREAVTRGLRFMMIEKAVIDSLAEKDVKKNARKIYTSLVSRPVKSASEITG